MALGVLSLIKEMSHIEIIVSKEIKFVYLYFVVMNWWQDGTVSMLVLFLWKKQTQESFVPWPQVTNFTSCCSEEEPRLPKSPQVLVASLWRLLWGRTRENIHESLDCLPSQKAGLAQWVWSALWGLLEPHSVVKNPILGPGWKRKQVYTAALYALLLPITIQIFLFKRNFLKEKQNFQISHWT